MACIKSIIQLLIFLVRSRYAREKKEKRGGQREREREQYLKTNYTDIISRDAAKDHELWSTSDERRERKGLKPLRTLSRGTRRAEFGPNEKANAEKRSERSEAFTGCLRGPSVTLTPSKCNNIYIRAQPWQRVGRAPEILWGRGVHPSPLSVPGISW